MNRMKKNKNKGFSLVELIIVIAIMAILAGILIPQFVRYIGNSRKSADIQQAENIYNAVAALYADDSVAGTSTLTYDGALHEVTGGASGVSVSLNMGQTAPASKVDSSMKFYYACTSSGTVTVYIGPATGADATNSTQISPSISGPDASKWN